MASTTESSSGKRIQAWVPPALAEQVRVLAEHEQRSVSQILRMALQDRLRGDRNRERRP